MVTTATYVISCCNKTQNGLTFWYFTQATYYLLSVIYSLTEIETETGIFASALTTAETKTEIISKTEMKEKQKIAP